MSQPSPEFIKKAICDLTSVEVTAFGFEIALPQIYGNGDVVIVSVQREGDGFYIHDGGNASMTLESMGATITTRTYDELKKGVAAYACQFSKSRVFKRCANIEEIAATASIVGCASRFVADYIYQSDAPPLFDFRRKVLSSLSEFVGLERIKENVEVLAHTGTKYHISAAILDSLKTKPEIYIEAVSSHESVARKFRAMYDLKLTPMISETIRVSIFDDERSGITNGDLNLLREVSEIVPFSERDRLVKRLEELK
jgi:hypothetical protein